HMMVCEDLSVGRDQKAGAEDVEMDLGPGAGEAEDGIVALVGERIACGSHTGVVKRESTVVVAEGKHHMDEANAGLVRLDDVLREAATSFELLYAPLYLAQLLFQLRSGGSIAVGNLCLQLCALLLQLCFLGLVCRHRAACHFIARPADVFE